MNIASYLMPELRTDGEGKKAPFEGTRVILLDQDLVRAEGFPDGLKPRPDLAIFASRHESESGMPCLTVHFPGNISEARHGGETGRVSMAAALYMKKALRSLSRHGQGLPLEVTVEATHHGPLTDVPCFFIEIGSRHPEWINREAGKAVAEAILEAIKEPPQPGPVALGLGGPHYSRGFTKLLLNTEFSLSHIVPKHQIKVLDDEVFESLLPRSEPIPKLAILDWKGIRGEERRSVLASLERIGLEYVRLQHCL